MLAITVRVGEDSAVTVAASSGEVIFDFDISTVRDFGIGLDPYCVTQANTSLACIPTSGGNEEL
jgi:hypothetical protein